MNSDFCIRSERFYTSFAFCAEVDCPKNIISKESGMQRITSKENKKIKLLSKLLTSQKERSESGLFVLEGLRLVEDGIRSGAKIKEVYMVESFLPKFNERLEGIVNEECELYIIDDFILPKITDTKTPQGVVALFEGSIYVEELPQDMSCGSLLLSNLQDPGNLGTIVRSAAAFDLSAVIITGSCPSLTSPKVLRASMGGVFKLPIVRFADDFEALRALKERNIPVYAAFLDNEAKDADTLSLKGACVAIGNEGNGLAKDFAGACDEKIIIPISENTESLNASIAGSIFAWEIKRAGN